MDLKKTKEKEAPLLGRKEVTFKASFTEAKTPTHADTLKAVADNLKVSAELVQINKIAQDFGSATATIEAYIYKDAATLNRFKPKIKTPKEAKKE